MTRSKISKNFSTVIKLKNTLKIFAILLVGSLFLKSLVYVDWSGDTWLYHLPFAARIWGMVSPQEYQLYSEREVFYQGFPLFANALQGLFWRIAGFNFPQAANLVSFLSLVIFLLFLRHNFKIPLYLSAISLLAVPLIHIATTASNIDIFCNVPVAILILMTYCLYIREDFLTRNNIAIFTLFGAISANSKHTMVPPLILIIVVAVSRIFYLQFIRKNSSQGIIKIRKILHFFVLFFSANAIIFAWQIRNLITYGNPFYPLKITVAGFVLNHAIALEGFMSPYLQALHPAQRWIYSLLEIGAFDERRPWLWTIAMDFVPLGDKTFGMGGYMAFYVVFNIAVFLYLVWCKWGKEAKIAFAFVVVMSAVTAILPYSYQLRYYMYWIMVLIAFNLYLASIEDVVSSKIGAISSQQIGLVAAGTVIAFCIVTRWDYTYPEVYPLSAHIARLVKPDVIDSIKDGERVCLVGFAPYTFLYSSKFHPPRQYSVKAEFDISPEYVTDKCGSRRIIRNIN